MLNPAAFARARPTLGQLAELLQRAAVRDVATAPAAHLATEAAAAAPPPPPPASLPALQRAMEAALAAGRLHRVASLLRGADADVLALAAAAAPAAAAHVYDCALRAAAAAGDAAGARALLGEMWRRGVPVGRVAQGSVLKALCAAGRREEAARHLRRIPGGRLTPAMFNTVLGAAAAAGDAGVGLRVWEHMRRRGVAPDARSWAAAFTLHAAAGGARAVEAAWATAADELAAAGEGARAEAGAARVAALAGAGDTAAAAAACEEMMDALAARLPVALDLPAEPAAARAGGGGAAAAPAADPLGHLRAACNAALRGAGVRCEWAAMRSLAALMTRRGLPPDAGTYNALLAAALRRGDGAAAVREGAAEMAALGIAPDAHTRALLAAAAAGEGDAAGAAAAADAARAAGDAPSLALWLPVLRAHAARGDLAGLADAYDRGRGAGLHLDARALGVCLDGVRRWAARAAASHLGAGLPSAERAHGQRLAAVLLRRWAADVRASRLRLDAPLVAALAAAYGHAGLPGEAVRLMRWRYGGEAPVAAGGVPPPRLEGHELDAAVLAAAALPAPGAPPPPGAAGPGVGRAFAAAIAAVGRGGDLRAAAELARRARALGVPFDSHVYTALIGACAAARRPGLAAELLVAMGREGVAPTTWTLNALAKVEAQSGDVAAALAVVEGMATRGLTPDAVSWGTLLAAARAQGRGEVAARAAAELAALRGDGDGDGADADAPAEERHWPGYFALQEEEEDW
jgi:pentatricopeptide repeat protein